MFKGVRRAIIYNREADYYYFNYRRYTLGKSHLKFFYPRLQYIFDRHVLLVFEMKKRGIAPPHTDNIWVAYRDIPEQWYRTYTPTSYALNLNRRFLADNPPKENSRFRIKP